MHKIKKQILLFIIIILVGVSYAINEYIITPEKLLIQQRAKQMQVDKQKLSLLKSKSSEAVKLNEDISKLKKIAESIGDVTVTDINTPQLIFDFYSSCKKYGIKGEDLLFQLADSSTAGDKAASGTTSDSSSGITNQNTNSNASTAKTQPNTTSNKTVDTSKIPATTDLLKLTIELKVSGDKNKVENYIRSLNTLTSRKINVKSIKLEATLSPVVNNTTNTTNPNTILSPIPKIPTQPVTDQVSADIIFNQYIYSDGKPINRPSNYSFYDGQVGFSNFSDMFK